MSSTTATDTFGVLLKRGDGASPESFTALFEMFDLDPPGFDRNFHDATHHESPRGVQEWIAGLRLAPQFTCQVNWIPDNASMSWLDATRGIIYDQVNAILHNYQIAFPDAGATVATFAAFVKAFKPSAMPVNGKMTATVTFQITGEILLS